MTKTHKGGAVVELRQLSMNELALQLRQHLRTNGSACLVVTGHSMVPMLRNGRDTVTLIPVSDRLKPGDVIFYQRPDQQLVLHRIIRMQGKHMVCSGDHQFTPEVVCPEQVIGIVSCFERAGSRYCVNAPLYRVYASVITAAFPVRRPFLAFRRILGRIKRFLRR